MHRSFACVRARLWESGVVRFFAVCLLMLLGISSAHALLPKGNGYAVSRYGNVGGSGTIYSSPESACASGEAQAVGRLLAQNSGVTFVRTEWVAATSFCKGVQDFSYSTIGIDTISNQCPANSTPVTGGCQCNATFDESGGQCVPHTNRCTADAGKVKVTNWTVGFFRTPDDNDFSAVGPVNKLPASGNFCAGGCTMNVPDPGAPGWAAWRSQSPSAQGLYRGSLDIPAVNSGNECTAGPSDAPLNPVAGEPACPGSVGEVNGKLGCYGTAQSPVVTTPTERPVVPPIAGNPAAGPKPATGEGSGTGSAGRTPTNGNGGNAGGPAGAGQGGKGGSAGGTATGTGTTKNGEGKEEKDPCGAPGQAECSVKVNEKGTPEGAGKSFDDAKKALDDSAQDTLQKINAARDRTDGPRWTFSFALPTGCSPYTVGIGEVTLDVCRYQGTIHDLLSMVWAAVTAFTIIGMVGRTIRGT